MDKANGKERGEAKKRKSGKDETKGDKEAVRRSGRRRKEWEEAEGKSGCSYGKGARKEEAGRSERSGKTDHEGGAGRKRWMKKEQESGEGSRTPSKPQPQ